MVRRALVLGGGAARGAVQVAVARSVGSVDAVFGTSIGAVNASLVAAGRYDDLEAIWRTVDGTKTFQRVAVDAWNGLYSLKRLRKLLDEHKTATRLQCSLYVGLVDTAKGRHEVVWLDDLDVPDRRDAIVGSSTQPIIHRHWQFQGRWVLDGGVSHVLTPIPRAMWSDFDEVHVVACSPVEMRERKKVRSQKSVAQVWEQATVAYDLLMTSVMLRDVDRLHHMVDAGLKVILYAPKSWEQVGEAFNAGKDEITRRLEVVGPWMRDHASAVTKREPVQLLEAP